MATTPPSSRDVEQTKKDLAAETKRVDGLVTRLNEIFVNAKANDDRIEKSVKALAVKVASGGQSQRITQIVTKLNESLIAAKKNDDRLEAMIKALEVRVDQLGRK